jgi:hypothetical protein
MLPKELYNPQWRVRIGYFLRKTIEKQMLTAGIDAKNTKADRKQVFKATLKQNEQPTGATPMRTQLKKQDQQAQHEERKRQQGAKKLAHDTKGDAEKQAVESRP